MFWDGFQWVPRADTGLLSLLAADRVWPVGFDVFLLDYLEGCRSARDFQRRQRVAKESTALSGPDSRSVY